MNRINKLYVFWILAVVVLFLISRNFTQKNTDFYGIAETREIVVSSESPVEVREIHVVAGQKIKKGDLLVELDKPELDIKINQTSHLLTELKAQKGVDSQTLKATIDELEAEIASKKSEINYEIKQLQQQYLINKKLTAKLKSIKKENIASEKGNIDNPFELRIESLKKELELAITPMQIKIDMLKKELHSPENANRINTERLEKKLVFLYKEKSKLYHFAQIDGIIGSVNFKDGETVSPFSPVLTLHTKSPSFIKGFIHENVYNQIAIGNNVQVTSLAAKGSSSAGQIVGVGSRIVEFPVRLRKNPDFQVWGREVLVKINDLNSFLLGEKVLITTAETGKDLNIPFLPKVEAIEADRVEYVSSIKDINIDKSIGSIKNIEASGVVYLSDLKKYLVISDETKKKKPILFLMDLQGNIIEKVKIQGIDKIDDLEAICFGKDENEIYISCSQNFTKKGKLPESRKLLLKIKRERDFFKLEEKLNLYDCIKEFAKANRKSKFANFIGFEDSEFEINIEGLFYKNNSLYFGFKKPFLEDKTVIAKIDNIFDKKSGDKLNIDIWKELNLKDGSGQSAGISDLYLRNGKLYILSCRKLKKNKDGNKGNSCSLWSYNIAADALFRIIDFANLKGQEKNTLKPEGIGYNKDKDEFILTFDQGASSSSKYMILRGI